MFYMLGLFTFPKCPRPSTVQNLKLSSPICESDLSIMAAEAALETAEAALDAEAMEDMEADATTDEDDDEDTMLALFFRAGGMGTTLDAEEEDVWWWSRWPDPCCSPGKSMIGWFGSGTG